MSRSAVVPRQRESYSDSFALLVEELTAKVQAGEAIDVEAFLQAHPEDAEQLRRLLPALLLLAEVSNSAGGPGPRAAGDELGELGDFRIIREVGRGGMGVVYEAEQVSLGRRVALKVLPFAATMDPRHLQRFHNEARAAASLHHEHIVPVHAVGCERAVHFYAMQFIEGQSLAELIAVGARSVSEGHHPHPPSLTLRAPTDAPTVAAAPTQTAPRDTAYFRRVAEWGIQAAEALEHAHQLGIVHRDVKPANLLVDGRGKLWVTDFGLARLGADAGLTMTGDVVGTLRYMSPEQALARHGLVDHRTDVYSLGATLYELLTGRPAVEGQDRQDILNRIADEEPRPPRALDRAVPADLETIVLKALEKNPQDRYATAQELADDLRHWLEDRPIRARRPTLVQRARRWGRRHRPLVAGVTAALLVGLAVLAGGLGWVASDRAARRAAAEAVIAAALEDSDSWQRQGRSSEALSAARRADGLLAGADVREALRQQVRARLADLELLDRLEKVRLETATGAKDGHFDTEGADALYAQMLREAGLDVMALSPEEAGGRIASSTVAVELAAVLDDWAMSYRTRGEEDGPRSKHLLRVARVADPDPWRSRVREALEKWDLHALRELAAAEETLRLPPATLSVVGQALLADKEARAPAEVFLREARRRHPNDFWLNHNLYNFLRSLPPPAREEAYAFAAVEVALRPDSPGTHANLGNVLRESGRLDEAIAEYREAIRLNPKEDSCHTSLGVALGDKGLWDEALAEHYEVLRRNPNDALAHYNLGVDLANLRRPDEAATEYRKAISLNKHVPEDKDILGNTLSAHAHYNLGNIFLGKNQWDEAAAEFREAIRFKNDKADAHCNLGQVFYRQGKLPEAVAAYRKAIEFKPDLVQAYQNLGAVLDRLGQYSEAVSASRKVIELKPDYALAYSNLSNPLRHLKRLSEAEAACRKAIELKTDFPDAYYNLGLALYDQKKLRDAVAAYRKAIELKPAYAEAHCNLGHTLREQGQFAEALAALKRGHELGSKDPGWRYPSPQWVRQAELLVALENKLPHVLKGELQPADMAERLMLAWMCQQHKRLYVAVSRLYAEAFAAEPGLAAAVQPYHRYNAACAAALAGCGQGNDADSLDDKTRASLRRQALDWLRADLAAWSDRQRGDPEKAGPGVAQQLKHWLEDRDFAGERGEALARLPEAERGDWQRLWEEVEALRQRAAKQAEPASPARP